METFNPQTILLVEDDENDVLFMEFAIKRAGLMEAFQVAEDGQEAIDYLSGKGKFADRTRFPLPALMLLDLKLPRVMGMDVLKWIRDQPSFETLVVIMLTSSQQQADIQKAYALGANSYLVKPSNPGGLAEIVELVKRYWLTLNQPTAAISQTTAQVGVKWKETGARGGPPAASRAGIS